MNTFNFHEVAEQLILFIQKQYGITISEIVLDFAKDQLGIEWFLGCKAFKYVDKGQRPSNFKDIIRGAILSRLMYFGKNPELKRMMIK